MLLKSILSYNQSYGSHIHPQSPGLVLTLIWMAVKKCIAIRLGVIYDSPGNQEERRRFDVMPSLWLEVLGECLGRGWWWRGLNESNKPPHRLEYLKKGTKDRWFPALSDLKNCWKHCFFTQKYLIIYTFKMFSEEYMNLKTFCYLRRRGVIQ
jgi:hypothetical protein